jgi:ribokinase
VRTAVVGHVEWVEFAAVERVPAPGEIVAARRTFDEPAGGGGVAAVQLARLAGGCTLYTALGDDEQGRRSRDRLAELGVEVAAATRRGAPTRRALTFVDDAGERTIVVLGERLQPVAGDALPWAALAAADAVYFTAGDAAALRAARAARTLVATARARDAIAEARVELDALVGSAVDPAERCEGIDPEPRLVVETAGAEGGGWHAPGGRGGRFAAVQPSDPAGDAYGCGDSFAAGLTFALASGRDVESSLELAARCGAECSRGTGPYERQLTLAAR